MFPDIYFHKVV